VERRQGRKGPSGKSVAAPPAEPTTKPAQKTLTEPTEPTTKNLAGGPDPRWSLDPEGFLDRIEIYAKARAPRTKAADLIEGGEDRFGAFDPHPFAGTALQEGLIAKGGPMGDAWQLTDKGRARLLRGLTVAEGFEALDKLQSDTADQYWRFSRSSSPKVAPPGAELHGRISELKTALRYQARPEAVEAYQDKREAKADRLAERAEKKRSEASAAYSSSRGRLDRIPMGQPILVGHHSERKHRRDIERSNRDMRKAVDTTKEAERLERAADAAQSDKAIRSDDPEAPRKIKERIAAIEAQGARYRDLNRAVGRKRKSRDRTDKDNARSRKRLAELGLSEKTIETILTPDTFGEIGIPQYLVGNLRGNLRRLRKRLEEIEHQREKAGREEQHGDVRLVEEENRVRLFFPGKPDADTRKKLKSYGFRWAPSVGAWQMHASDSAWARARHNILGVPR